MSWWNNSWTYRKKLTFDNSGQSENLTDFPVLVKLTSSNFDFSLAKDNGEDIRFVDSNDTTLLKHEIENWNKTGEKAWIWVKVPQIDGTSSTDFIYMYYGNSGASDGQDAANTWDSHYKAVYHLNKSSGVVVDSKGVNNGTNNGATRGQTGKIDNCFSFDGQDDYVNCGNDASLQIKEALTVEGWIKRDVTDDLNTIASKLRFQDNKRCWFLFLRDDADNNKIQFYVSKDGVGNNLLLSNTGISDTVNWHYVVATYQYITDGTSVIKIYLDGNPDGSKNDVLGDLYAENGEPVRIGTAINAAGATDYHHDGLLDEVRISDSVRSADWIKAQYLSMTLAFVTFGDLEIHSSDAGFGGESLGSRLFGAAESGSGVGASSLLVALIGTETGLGSEFATKVFSAVDSGLGVDVVVTRLLSAIEAGSALEAALLTAGLISGDGGLGSDLSSLLKAILAYDEGSGLDALRALIEIPATGSDMRLHTSPGQVRIPSKEVNL